MKWKTIIGLFLVVLATIFNWLWMWGILFLYWVYFDLVFRRSYFIEKINRDENPVLYWIIIVTWIFLGSYYLVLYLPWKVNPFL